MNEELINSIADLQKNYKKTDTIQEKDKLYQELLEKYEAAQKRIDELESEKNRAKLPTKDEVDTMASMLDLINKLDEGTIEKLNRFGQKKI